jgi:hypothetical protein
MPSRRRRADRQVNAAPRLPYAPYPSCRRSKERDEMPPGSYHARIQHSSAETASYRIRTMSRGLALVSPSAR